MHLLRLILMAVLAAFAAPAGADVTVRYTAVSGGGLGLLIEADANGRLRVESGSGQVLIVRDGETYVVPPGNGPRAVRGLEDFLAEHAERLAEARRSGQFVDAAPTRYTLREHGPQMIGAWQGRRYTIDPVGGSAPELSSEIIISTDPALAPAARAAERSFNLIARILEAAAGLDSPDFARLSRELLTRGLPLSVEGIYRLESVATDPVPAARFDLPGPVLGRDASRDRPGR